MAALAGRLTIVRGSDLGTICYEIIVRSPFDGPGSPMSTRLMGLYTAPPGGNDFPGGTQVFTVTVPTWDEVHTGCIGGLDQALVTDVFANPGAYWYTVTTCFELIGCGSVATTLAPEGSACMLVPTNSQGSIDASANMPFDLQGVGFVPGSVAHVTFTPEAAPDHPGVLDIPVTEYSTFTRVMAGRTDQIGAWTVTATGPGGCDDTRSLRIFADNAGPVFPAGATALPGGVLGTGASPEPAPSALPNTAMPPSTIH